MPTDTHVYHVADATKLGHFACHHCGDTYSLGDNPIPVTEYCRIAAEFQARHKDCPAPDPAAPEEPRP